MKYVDSIAINNCAAKAAIDIALHDLVGKMMGQPWWKIWGWDPTTCPNTSFTVGLDTEDVVREKTKEAAPYKVIKVKLGRTEEQDKMMINTIRSVTDTVICVDANQGWKDKYYALDMIHWLNERNVNMIEQPMSKYALDQTAWLTERSPLPIIADEACQRLTDVKKLHGAYHGINIKLMKCTGLREAREMVSLAQSLDMKLMVGCMSETSCAISAGAQIAPKTEWADLDGNVLIANDCFGGGMKVVDGKVTLSDAPGLGLEITKDTPKF
jgi:L-alanine-DL-glutamate epimerase-like enolase superfamily enzyme